MRDQLVLMVGATGNTGSGIIAGLLERGIATRAIVRDPDKAEELRARGVDAVVADLDDASSLTSDLFDGVTDVYFCTWNGPTALDHWKNFKAALDASGAAPRIVRGSAFGSPRSRIIEQIAETDEDLKRSGLRWTILQPTFFMQNTMMLAPSIRGQDTIYYDWDDGKVGMIDVRDIVDAALGALTAQHSRFDGQVFVLTGPRAIGFEDVAHDIGQALDRELTYVPVDHDSARAAVVEMGVPEWIADGYVELSMGFKDGFADTTTDGVLTLAGHPPRSFAEFAREHADAWR